jgi:hypothetical protein
MRRISLALVVALLASTSIASAASRNHLTRHHYRAGASAGTGIAAHFQSKFDNN